MINVAVCGSSGKMGKEVVRAVSNSGNMNLVAKIDINGGDYTTLKDALETVNIDVLVDFTQPASVYENALLCLNNGIKPVIGTTGLNDGEIAELEKLTKSKNTGCLIAPNFSTGAVLMMMFAKKAAEYFDNAEIIELHHNKKKDAPSGTAIKTALMMSEAKKCFTTGNCPETETIKGARGGEAYANIHIHSVRMPGYIASQEVIFGEEGQIFKLRHDSMNRECYMKGVMLAINYISSHNEFIYGLEKIM